MNSTLAQTTIGLEQIQAKRNKIPTSAIRPAPSPSHDVGLAISRATSRIPPLGRSRTSSRSIPSWGSRSSLSRKLVRP